MSKHDVFMEVAQTIAQLGTCDRKQVGAILIRDGRCISWGFNGAPPGLPHCDENMHGWTDLIRHANPADSLPDLYELADKATQEHGCRNATHAEANALAFAARQGISTDGATLYVTISPCENCARLLIAAGIERVYYSEAYRDRAGIELLKRALIQPSRI
jgi:dCMP deaminase